MKRKALSRTLVIALLALLAFGATPWVAVAGGGGGAGEPPATRGQLTIELEIPSEMKVGQETTLQARLHDGGPISGAEVAFLTAIRFAGTAGTVELGRATTDQRGIARLEFLPRWEGELTITARFAGDARRGPAEGSRKVMVQPGPPLYFEKGGVPVAGLLMGFLLAILGTVWSIYLIVVALVWRIAHKGHGRPGLPHSGGVP